VRLKDGLENHRHILLWPEWKAEIEVPKDVREILSPKY
jgi:hypothetical protein